jgi:O-glycosyl hydrolase
MNSVVAKTALFAALLLSVVLAIALLPSRRALAGNEVEVEVHFEKRLRPWDGFGVNYVEAAQTRDYKKDPQEYGGFSTLSEEKRREILDLIFGADGLKPGVLKMFLDPFHEGMTEAGNDNRDPNVIDQSRFDHKTYTEWMRYFVREGLKRTRAWGRAEMPIVTTLYGPPAWMTKQKFMRGRDLDPQMREEMAEYMIAWVKFLRDEEKFPVKYVSLHNEGEDFVRWPTDGSWGGYARHDYNMYWHSSQVVDYLKLMRPMLDRQGLKDVGITPGETSRWDRFINWGYAWAIYQDDEAMRNLALITSHGFGSQAENTGMGNDLLRLKKPDLRSWTTSMSWGQMDVNFVEMMRQNIYDARVNSIIPWACIQTDTWVGGDPNPGTAFRVDGKGGYTVEPGYYFFKQVSRAGQPGMAVADVVSQHPDVKLIAFSSNGTEHPDALTVINLGTMRRDLIIRVTGSGARAFDAYVTTKKRGYKHDGVYALRGGALETTVFGESVVTFFAKP